MKIVHTETPHTTGKHINLFANNRAADHSQHVVIRGTVADVIQDKPAYLDLWLRQTSRGPEWAAGTRPSVHHTAESESYLQRETPHTEYVIILGRHIGQNYCQL